MLNNSYISGALRFVGLVLAQTLIFNKINLFGQYNPMIYLLFLYWYPVKNDRASLLAVAFLLGFVIDLFSDTMAMHTAATLTTAFFRIQIMGFVFGVNLEFQNLKVSQSSRLQQFTFLGLMLIIHHLVFFSLEIFSLTNFLLILRLVLVTGMISFIFSALLAALFSSR
jgi:rod shape-determining protein MreD